MDSPFLIVFYLWVSYYSWGFNISTKHLSPDVVSSGFSTSAYVLSALSRFISRTKRFRPFDYACLSVELLQSSAADCIVRCSGPYSLLQWTVQSITGDCNNLSLKKPWLSVKNGLILLLFEVSTSFPLFDINEDSGNLLVSTCPMLEFVFGVEERVCVYPFIERG